MTSAPRRLPPLVLLALFAIAVAIPGATSAVPRQDEDARAVAVRERYLLVNPWHPRVFREYRDLLADGGGIDERCDELAARSRAGERTAGVLAARLWAGAGEVDRALATLAELELADEPRAALLRAEWLARAARLEAAADEAEAALAALPPGEERDRGLRLALAIAAQRGARQDGARAVARLVAERPDDVELRLELVDELLHAGWVEPARETLDGARAALVRSSGIGGAPGVGIDVTRVDATWVDVHLAEARVAAALGDAGATERAWRAALEILGRGHWRRASVRAAAIEAARATGALGAWRDELAAEVERGAGVVAFEDLATLELARGRTDVAWDVLARAAAAYPEDDALRAMRLELARRTGRARERLALLQERAERAGTPAVVLDLADALVAAGRVEAARVQWDRCAEAAADDAQLLARIARRRGRHGEDAAVGALLERVAELAADDPGAGLAATVELARHHARHGRRDAAGRALSAAQDARADDPGALEELGAAWAELGEPARAEAAWRAALDRRAGAGEAVSAARLARRLARLQQDEGRPADARATLAPWVEEELRGGRGSPTLAQLLATFRGRDELARAAEREARRALAGEGGRASWYLAATGRARTGDAAGAIALWRSYLERAPDDGFAREALGLLEVERGDLAAAAETLTRLEAARAGAGRELRMRLARAFAGAGERTLALRTLAPLARQARPRDLAGLVRLQLELGAVDEARATRRRATALGADDPETRLALAAALSAAGDAASARDELRAAYGLAPEERRAAIVETLLRSLSPAGSEREGPEREAWIGELLREARRRPLDDVGWSLAADLRLASGDPRAARDLLDEAASANPARPALLWRRARASAALGRSDAALADLRRARLLGLGEMPEAAAIELRALLASGRSEEAVTVALASDRPRAAAAVLREHGERAAALRVLEAARDARPDPAGAELELELGELYLSLDRVPEAIAAFERHLLLGPPDPRLLERIGDLHFASGDEAAGVGVGLRLLAAGPRVGAARGFFERHGRLEEWMELACARALRRPPDLDEIEELGELLGRDPRGVRALQGLHAELGAAARRTGRAPEGWAAPAWALACAEAEARLLRAWPGVLAARCEALRARLLDPRPLSGREWIELAFVAPVEGDDARLAAALRGEPDDPAVAAALARLAAARPRLAGEFARHAARLARRLDGGDLVEAAGRERERREIALALARETRDPRRAAWVSAGDPPPGALAWLDPDLLSRHAAVAAAAAGDVALEKELDAALDRAAAARLSGLLARIEADVARGRFADADRGLERLAARAREVADAPSDVWRRAAAAFRAADAVPEGYAALRRVGRSDFARRLIRDEADRRRCAERFEAEARRASARLAALRGAGPDGGAETEAARRTLHEATILLLEFLPLGETADRASAGGLPDPREATERALALLPDDVALRARLARLEELEGRFRSALRERRRALEALEAGRGDSRTGRPRLAALESVRGVGDVRRSSAWRTLDAGASPESELRLGALRMELELGELGTLASLEGWLAFATADGPTIPTMLLHLLLGYDLEERLADHLAAVFARYPAHGTLVRALLTELCTQGRFAEARAALDRHLAAVPDPGSERRRVARLRERVDRLEAGDG